MHPLIVQAKETVASWSSDEPRELALAVAALCRQTLDAGGLPTRSPDWLRLRSAFDVSKGQSISESIVNWDECCRTADLDLDVLSSQEAYVKLGIVTWVVKFLGKKFGMLSGSEPITDFDEWKLRLVECFDKYILVGRNRANG
jgi:hypothetical protein